jgi:hypothetical protein
MTLTPVRSRFRFSGEALASELATMAWIMISQSLASGALS